MGSIAFVLSNQNFMYDALDNHFYKAWRSEKDVSLAILGPSYTTGKADVSSGIVLRYSKLRGNNIMAGFPDQAGERGHHKDIEISAMTKKEC